MNLIEKRKNRNKNLIANFADENKVGEFAQDWVFKVSKAFKSSLDIKETQIIKNKMATLEWTQGESYSFEIGDTFHNNILAYTDWKKYLQSNPTTLQISYVANALLNIDVYRQDDKNKNKLKLHGNLFLSTLELINVLKSGIYEK